MRVKVTISVNVLVPVELEVEVGVEHDPASHEIKEAELARGAAVSIREVEESLSEDPADVDELHRLVMEAAKEQK